jgi:acetoin utilization deacetylase AcuC-like enzyme
VGAVNDIGLVCDPVFLEHAAEGPHPENPRRCAEILARIEASPRFRGAIRIPPREATAGELIREHARPMVDALLAARGRRGWFDEDTYHGPRSVGTALLAAGATIDLAQAIWRGELRRGFSFVRPPGHHATAGRPMGFCLLNHVALAAGALRAASPGARLAIVDFDLHHGNGTQDLFYGEKEVLFLSSHRYPFYPGTGSSAEIGEGAARGTTINFPLGTRYGDELFSPLYAELALPMVDEFAPDMILVSAGYDGHERDPMQGFRLSTAFYGEITSQLIAAAERHCGGRILFCLEGGYDIPALGESVARSLDCLWECPREPFAPARGKSGDFAPLGDFRELYRPLFPSLR